MDVSLNPGPSQQPERPLERPQNSYFTSIKVGLLNTRSIVNKLSDFELFIMSNDLDIVLVTESWLSPSINDHEIVPQNFNIFRRDRNRNGGGVFIAAKPSLSPKTVAIFQHESLEIIWIEISTSRRKLLFGCCYRPPSASAQWHDLFQECLNSVLAISQNYLAIYICGDFNIFFTSDEPLQGQPKVLQDSLTALDMDQLINFITRPSPNLPSDGTTIDLLFNNRRELVTGIEQLPPLASSDHNSIIFSISLLFSSRSCSHSSWQCPR